MAPLSLRCALLPAFLLIASVASAQTGTAEACRDRSLDLEAIVAACDAAISAASDPAERGDLLSQRARALRLLGDLEAAGSDVEEALRLAPLDTDPLVERGYLLREADDLEGAVAALEQALEIDARDWRAVLVMMDVQGDVGDYDRCLNLAETAVEVAPERAHTWAYRGRCLYELGRNDEAIADYEKAAEIGLEEAFFHDNMSLAFWVAGRGEEAVAAARHAVELDPQRESARYSLIDALILTGDANGAIAAYRDAQAAGIEDTLGLANALAWGLYQQGRHAEALPILEDWFAAHPERTSDHVYELDTYAHLLAALGRHDEAVAAFLQAAELGGAEIRAGYEARLVELGFDASEDLQAALETCVRAGTTCVLN